MKKFLIISAVFMASLIIGIFILSSFQEKVEVINKEQLDTKMNNNETFVLVIAQSTCPACKNYKENGLKQYVNQDESLPVYMFYTDTNFSSEEERTSFFIQHGIGNYKNVPASFLVHNGTITGGFEEGSLTVAQLKDFISQQLA